MSKTQSCPRDQWVDQCGDRYKANHVKNTPAISAETLAPRRDSGIWPELRVRRNTCGEGVDELS